MAMYLGEDKVASLGSICNVSGNVSKNLYPGGLTQVFSAPFIKLTKGTYTITEIDTTSGNWYFGAYKNGSVLSSGVSFSVAFNWSSTTEVWYRVDTTLKGFTFTLSEDCIVQIGRLNATGTQKVQLEKGSTATEYEEYYEPIISVKDSNGDYHEVPYVTGKASKNLYDKKTVHIEGASNQNASNEIPVLPNTTYTFSIGKYTYGEVKEFDNSGVQINDIGGSESSKIITFTTSSNAKYITTLFFTGTYNNVSLNEIDFTQIQLELGSTATEYEEYFEPIISIRDNNGNFHEIINEVETTTNITMADGYSLSGAAFEKQPILEKQGKIVHLAMLVVAENGFVDTLTGIARLPEGFRPKYTQVFPCGLANAHLWYIDSVGYLNIGSDGYINIRNSTGTQKYAFINVTFMTD